MSFVGVAAGIGAVGGLFKIGEGIHQNHLANKVVVPDASYESSPYAAKMLGEATRLKNAPMPGLQTATQGIETSEADTNAGVQRNATSGSQALALLAATHGQTDSAFSSLSTEQNQYQQNAENNYNNALNTEIGEGDKVYQSDLQKRLSAIQEKTGLRGAAATNVGSGVNDVTNNAFMYGAYLNGQPKKP